MKVKSHVLANGLLFCRWACVVALALLSLMLGHLPAYAGGTTRSEYAAFMDLATGAGKHTVSFGGGGVPMATAATGSNLAGNMRFGSSGGFPAMFGTSQMSTPFAGKTLPLDIVQKGTKASAGRAMARYAYGFAGPLGAAAGIGLLLYDLYGIYNEFNAGTGKNDWYTQASGALYVLTAGRCGNNGVVNDVVIGSPADGAAACQAAYRSGGLPNSVCWAINDHAFRCERPDLGSGPIDLGMEYYGPDSSKHYLTEQELADRIANESGWPDSMAGPLSTAVNWPGQTEVIQSQGPASVSGPGSVMGPVQTFDYPDKQVTKQKELVCTYAFGGNGEVECTEKETTKERLKDPVTGALGAETTTQTTTKPPDSTGPAETPCDPANKSVKCATLDQPTGEVPTTSRTISFTPENLGLGNGACPAPVTWTDTLGSHAINLAQYCDVVSSVVKPLVLAAAALMALLILMPARTE